jgi:hypothetical protein
LIPIIVYLYKMDITEINKTIVYECKNYLYMFFKQTEYTREFWFKYLDYFGVNVYNKLLPVIIPVFILNFILSIILVSLIKHLISNSHKNKRHYYSRIF